MLFNSYEYILVFLPVTVLVFLVLGRNSRSLALGWLILASVAFYAWWRPVNVAIIAPSIALNYLLGRVLLGLAGDPARARRRTALLALGIAFNVCFLGYFKYANFAVSVANDVSGQDWVFHQVILPLGISFITFQKIAFLIDVAGGRIKAFTLRDYLLFVMFFPQLIAGPIIHYGETIPQFERATCRFDRTLFAVGVTLFCFGLFKKVVLADGMAAHVTPVFAYAATGAEATFLQSWLAAVGFTLQIYFDFSGYSDMACGAALFFGIRLPINFDSPLKATSIVDFWLRWHITLTRFLTAYVYNPMALALTRARAARRLPMLRARDSHPLAFLHVLAFPTITTMALSGVWHGAGYTFILWGLLHGLYLVVNHLWRQYGPRPADPTGQAGPAAQVAGFALTFLAVVVAMVLFRAPDLASAGNVLAGMVGLNGIGLPGARFGAEAMHLLDGAVEARVFASAAATLLALLAIALLLPNSVQILAAYEPVLYTPKRPAELPGVLRPVFRRPLAWRPTLAWMVLFAALGAVSMIRLTGMSEFLYWQF
jgi:alginate O-acetyltransferase complex protein AlgI